MIGKTSPYVQDVGHTTRASAKAAGAKRYLSDKDCPRGHKAPLIRQTVNGSCAQCNMAWAMKQYDGGYRQSPEGRATSLVKWNGSSKGYAAKRRWVEKDRVRAWIVWGMGATKARAKKRGVPFDLTHEYLRSLIVTHCPVLGIELKYAQDAKQGGLADSATIDRIIPSAGYVQGNVAVISHRANAIKNDGSADEIEAVAKWVRAQCPKS